MTDGVIKGDGTSRLAKASGWPETYEGFKALAESSGIPLDLIFNSSGWQQLPTFLSKATLLQDFTAQLLGLDPADNPTVDDALLRSYLLSTDAGLIKVKVYETGTTTPISGVLLSGVTNFDGSELYTDDSGEALGIATGSSTTVSVNHDYLDLTAYTEKQVTVESVKIVEVTVYATRVTNPSGKIEKFTSSVKKMFTNKVKRVDVHAFGAGAGGSRGSAAYNLNGASTTVASTGGKGGGAGKSAYALSVDFTPNEYFQVVIGAKGTGASSSRKTYSNASVSIEAASGTSGGLSSCLGVVASGGDADVTRSASDSNNINTNIYNPVYGANGADSKNYLFGESELGTVAGGDGGGGHTACGLFYYQSGVTDGSNGGNPYGGKGGNISPKIGYPTAGNGEAATGIAGGGGGGSSYANSSTTSQELFCAAGGNGYNGVVYVRWFYE